MSDVPQRDQPSVLFARQPIFDQSLEIVAFELLFRHSQDELLPWSFDGNHATSTVLLNAFTQSDLESVSLNKPIYVNFTAETLGHELPLDPSHLVVEVLEDTPLDDTVRQQLVALRQQGFTLALDDYTYAGADHPFLALVDIVKLEYPHYSHAAFDTVVTQLRKGFPQLKLLAEKVETQGDLEHCQAAGCDLFQGYFLARPQLVHGKPVTTDRLATLNLIAMLNRPDVGVKEISNAVERAPALGIRLLRLVNTARYQHRVEITSLYQAVTLIGTERIRSLATLLALSDMQDKPDSLQQLALTRACLCRELVSHDTSLADRAFIAGLFSFLDAFFNRPLETLIASLPLHTSINAALLHHKGPIGAVLKTAIHLERGEWRDIPWARLQALGIDPVNVSDANQRAMHEVGELTLSAGF